MSSVQDNTGYVPINWNAILDHNHREFTPESVRTYLSTTVEKMNRHFSVIMFGHDLGKIQVTHYSRTGSVPDNVTISMSKSRQLFSKCVYCRWIENGKRKKIFKKAIEFWLVSSTRKELYFQPVKSTQIKSEPVKLFIERLVNSSESSLQLKLPGLNTRSSVYQLFEATQTTPSDWNPKSISQEIYRVIPISRPSPGKRVRKNGIACIYLPSKEILCSILQDLNDNARLLF
jgi:hypothetical protein